MYKIKTVLGYYQRELVFKALFTDKEKHAMKFETRYEADKMVIRLQKLISWSEKPQIIEPLTRSKPIQLKIEF